MPVCVTCAEDKQPDEFQAGRSKSGLRADCRRCRADTDRLRRYGITGDEFRRLLADQQGRCPVCDNEITELTAHVDHDHFCCPGKKSCGISNRGLLCNECNTGIGYMKDDPDILKAAIRYLTRRDHIETE